MPIASAAIGRSPRRSCGRTMRPRHIVASQREAEDLRRCVSSADCQALVECRVGHQDEVGVDEPGQQRRSWRCRRRPRRSRTGGCRDAGAPPARAAAPRRRSGRRWCATRASGCADRSIRRWPSRHGPATRSPCRRRTCPRTAADSLTIDPVGGGSRPRRGLRRTRSPRCRTAIGLSRSGSASPRPRRNTKGIRARVSSGSNQLGRRLL